jgi:AbiV family abortive infection protein
VRQIILTAYLFISHKVQGAQKVKYRKSRTPVVIVRNYRPRSILNEISEFTMKVPKERQLKRGVELCLDNVDKLIKDAEILSRGRSYGHSVFLAYSAIEEMSKAIMYAMSRIEPMKPSEFENMKRHSAKFDVFMGSQIIVDSIGRAIERGPQKPDRALDVKDFQEMEEDIDFLSQEVWNLRLQGLYVDYRRGKWSAPSDMTRKDAKYWIEHAKKYKESKEPLCRNIVSISEDKLKQPTEFMSSTLESLFKPLLEQFFKNAELAHKKGIITEELYKQIISKKGSDWKDLLK